MVGNLAYPDLVELPGCRGRAAPMLAALNLVSYGHMTYRVFLAATTERKRALEH